MSTSPTSLLDLPEVLLPGIIEGLDKRTLWRLMGTCRVLRDLAETALRPLLISEEVEAKPSMMIDIYTPLNCPQVSNTNQVSDLDERGGASWLINELFESHCRVYPSAFDCLRRLKVECWGMGEIGWKIFGNRDLQLQLERLELIIFDRINESTEDVWMDDIDVDDDTRVQLNAYRSWPPDLQDTELLDFPDLTHLTLTASGRTLSHFQQISSALPSLRVLTLSAHRRDFINPSYDPTYILHHIPLFPDLTSLTISGDEVSVTAISSAVKSRNRQIRNLIIHTNGLTREWAQRTPCFIPRDIRKYESLVSLGMFGPHASSILLFLFIITESLLQGAYTHLTHLSAEFSYGSSGPNWNELYYAGFPFLDHRKEDWPILPAIQRITLVCGTSENPNRHFIDPQFHHDAYLIPKVSKLFAHYPSLRILEWVNNYPPNPLQDELPPSWPEKDVLRRVGRDFTDGADTIHLIDTSSQLTSARVMKEED